MATDTPEAFAFLHKQSVKHFGTGRKMWFPAQREMPSPTYTVPVDCAEAPLTHRNVEDVGFVTMPDDGLVLHATRAQFPFEPRPDDLFTLGVEAGSGRKYRIVSATGAEGLYSHYRIVAERQQ